jgi:spore germination protein Q
MLNYWEDYRQQQPPVQIQPYQPPGMYQPQQFVGQVPETPQGMISIEMSFIENILRLNRGRMGTFYFTYENNPEWPAMVYRGRIEEAGRDHIIIYNPEMNKSYLLLMVNLDYVEFDDRIEYVPISPVTPDAQRHYPFQYPIPY